MAKYHKVRDTIQQMVVRKLLEIFTLQEVARSYGVTRQRIQQIAGKGYARFQGQRPRRVPHWEIPSRPDRLRIFDLCELGMSVREAVELLGYRWTGQANNPRYVRGRHRSSGGPRDDSTWRGWRTRWEREVRKLIARDAIAKGATQREAIEVSGLPEGTVHGWVSTGELPRTRYRQGFGYPVLRALEPSDASSTEPKPR